MCWGLQHEGRIQPPSAVYLVRRTFAMGQVLEGCEMTQASPKKRRFTARQNRVLEALLTRQGWIWREEIDRIAGASNGPEIIRQLRHHHGIEIDMRKVPRIDRDGRPCEPGQYKITGPGIAAAGLQAGDAV